MKVSLYNPKIQSTKYSVNDKNSSNIAFGLRTDAASRNVFRSLIFDVIKDKESLKQNLKTINELGKTAKGLVYKITKEEKGKISLTVGNRKNPKVISEHILFDLNNPDCNPVNSIFDFLYQPNLSERISKKTNHQLGKAYGLNDITLCAINRSGAMDAFIESLPEIKRIVKENKLNLKLSTDDTDRYDTLHFFVNDKSIFAGNEAIAQLVLGPKLKVQDFTETINIAINNLTSRGNSLKSRIKLVREAKFQYGEIKEFIANLNKANENGITILLNNGAHKNLVRNKQVDTFKKALPLLLEKMKAKNVDFLFDSESWNDNVLVCVASPNIDKLSSKLDDLHGESNLLLNQKNLNEENFIGVINEALDDLKVRIQSKEAKKDLSQILKKEKRFIELHGNRFEEIIRELINSGNFDAFKLALSDDMISKAKANNIQITFNMPDLLDKNIEFIVTDLKQNSQSGKAKLSISSRRESSDFIRTLKVAIKNLRTQGNASRKLNERFNTHCRIVNSELLSQ